MRRTTAYGLMFFAIGWCGTWVEAGDCWMIQVEGTSTSTEYEPIAILISYQPPGATQPQLHTAAPTLEPGVTGYSAAQAMREEILVSSGYWGWSEHLCLSSTIAAQNGMKGMFTILDRERTGTLNITQARPVPGLTLTLMEHPPEACACDGEPSIPAVGTWGMLVLALVVLISGRVLFRRRIVMAS